MTLTYKHNDFKQNKEQAEQTLNNVFMACSHAPNTTPVDRLMNTTTRYYQNNRLAFSVSVILFLVTLILPVFFYFYANSANAPVTKTNIKVLEHHIDEDTFSLSLSGDYIDYESIYLLDAAGQKVVPLSTDPYTGYVQFPFTGTEVNIYIYDLNRNELHLVLTPRVQKEY